MNNSKKKILSIPLAFTLCALVIGTMAKIQHWLFGKEIYVGSFVLIGIFYLIRFAFKSPKNLKDILKMMVVEIWVILSLFVLYKITGVSFLRLSLEIIVVIWLALEIRDLINRKPMQQRLNLAQIVGVLIFTIQFCFMLFRLPFKNEMEILYLFALILFAYGFILDWRINKVKNEY